MGDAKARAREALAKYRALTSAGTHFFKVGRAQASDFDGGKTKARPMYEGHELVDPLFRGSPRHVVSVEKFFIELSMKGPNSHRCVNEKAGGGDVGPDKVHVVYYVRWPDTEEGMLDAMLSGCAEELGIE